MNTHHSKKPYCGVKVEFYVIVVAELKGDERSALLSGSFSWRNSPQYEWHRRSGGRIMIGGLWEKCVKEWRPTLKYRSICMGNLRTLRTLESACQLPVLTAIGFLQNISRPGCYQVMSSPIAFVVFNWMALFLS
jgi:hypothetical protein